MTSPSRNTGNTGSTYRPCIPWNTPNRLIDSKSFQVIPTKSTNAAISAAAITRAKIRNRYFPTPCGRCHTNSPSCLHRIHQRRKPNQYKHNRHHGIPDWKLSEVISPKKYHGTNYLADGEYRMGQRNAHVMRYIHLRQRTTKQHAPRKVQHPHQHRRNANKFHFAPHSHYRRWQE